jgi:cytochrome c-type biogenesis protein CcmE
VTTVASPPATPPLKPRPKRRGRYIVAIGGCVIAVVAIVVLAIALSENVVYFRTVSEAVKRRTTDGEARFRIAGKVVRGSVKETTKGVDFELTDGKTTARIVHRGGQPALFKDGVPVVCEGHWGSGAVFDSDRILVRHGNDYSPPKVPDHQVRTGTQNAMAATAAVP